MFAYTAIRAKRSQSEINQKYQDNERLGEKFEGKVNGFSQTSENNEATRIPIQIWTFRLLRFDDKLGNPLPKIPVEMRGSGLEGFINEEDTVIVKGIWREGEVHQNK